MNSEIRIDKRQNSSTLFLLPALEINDKLKVDFYKFGFVDCYLFCDKCDEFEGIIPLYLYFRPRIMNAEFNKFCVKLEKNVNFMSTQDVPGGIIFIFAIPPKYHKDYKLFLKGKYSKFSNEFKSCFHLTVYKEDSNGNYERDANGKYITEYTDFYHIFNKTEELRNIWRERLGDVDLPDNLDLYSIYDKDSETLNIK